MASSRDLQNIDVAAALFDANDPLGWVQINDAPGEHQVVSLINIPAETLKFFQPENMRIEGPFDDGSYLVGLRLVPRGVNG